MTNINFLPFLNCKLASQCKKNEIVYLSFRQGSRFDWSQQLWIPFSQDEKSLVYTHNNPFITVGEGENFQDIYHPKSSIAPAVNA